MVLRKGALDYFDTILCVGKFQFDEIRETEKLYGLKEKRLVECGYGLLENLYNAYEKCDIVDRSRKKILIAPSWQPDNILDSCINAILDQLLGRGYDVVVRPHPEYVKRYGTRMDGIVERYAEYQGGDLTFELDFSNSNSIFDSDLVISDWSGTAYEFSFVTKRPVIFINTPPKINNLEYDKLSVKPLEILLRDKIGIQIETDKLDELPNAVENLFSSEWEYKQTISTILEKYISNFGNSGEVAARYIISKLKVKD
jgi:YidC/Oxa1 family membrane protein insertase